MRPIAGAAEFHERMRALDARFVRLYLPIAQAFMPYAEQSKSQALGDGSRLRGDPFDPALAAMVLVRVIDLTGTSTRNDLRGTDWFEKNDDEFAAELAVTVHRLRAVRRFLSDGGLSLIEYRVLRLPNRVLYRALWERINSFFSPPVSGWGQLELPLSVPSEAPGQVVPKAPDPPGEVLHNSGSRFTALGDAKNSTRSCGKRDSNKGNLYRKNVQTNPTDSVEVVGVRARARANDAEVLRTKLDSLGIVEPTLSELIERLAGVPMHQVEQAVAWTVEARLGVMAGDREFREYSRVDNWPGLRVRILRNLVGQGAT